MYALLLKPHLATYHFIGGHTPDKGFTGKFAIATRTGAGRSREVLADSLLKTFYQGTFAAFPVLKERCITALTVDIDGFARAFFIGFCHRAALCLVLPVFGQYPWPPLPERYLHQYVKCAPVWKHKRSPGWRREKDSRHRKPWPWPW